MDVANAVESVQGCPDLERTIGRLPIAGSDLTFRFSTSFDELEERWLAFEKIAVGTPFQSFYWLRNWYETVGKDQGVTPSFVCGYRGDELAVLIPLCVRKSSFTKCLTWLGHDLNDYNTPLVAEDLLVAMTSDDVSALWRVVAQAADDIDYMFLAKFPERVASHANPFAAHAQVDYTVGSHSVRLADNFDCFYSRARGAKARRRLRNKENKLANHGQIEYCDLKNPSDKADAVQRTLTWKSQQLDATGAINPFDDAATLELFDQFARNQEVADSLRVFALKVDGKIIAASFGFMSDDAFILYQTAYENGPYTQYSPGTLLLLQMFRTAIEEGKSTFDFSLGSEAYKFEWADTHDSAVVGVKALTVAGHCAVASLRLHMSAKRWMKKSPQRFAAARKVHIGLMKLKDRFKRLSSVFAPGQRTVEP